MKHRIDNQRGSLCIQVTGDILSTNAETIRGEMLKYLEADGRGCRMIEIQLLQARMVDSMGLNTLVSVVRRAKSLGLSARVLTANPSLHRIFRFTRLDQHMDVVLQEA